MAPFDSPRMRGARSWFSPLRGSSHVRREANDSERTKRMRRESKSPTHTTNKTVLSFPLMSWRVYIAQAPTGRYYTGITTDPHRRIQAHNRDEGAKFAHDQGALRSLYISLPFQTKSAARKREIQIKGWTREKKEKLIRGEWK